MIEVADNQFQPDYAVPPGEVLEDYLESFAMTQAELAERTGLAKKTVNEIVKGKAPITPETALRFERVFNRQAGFWNNLERLYQEDRARLSDRERLKNDLQWLKQVPVIEMAKHGWIKKSKDKVEQLQEVLSFYGVASPDQWQALWRTYEARVAYRQAIQFDASIESISAWLRKGRLKAQERECAAYSAPAFRAALKEIRVLTRELPEVFEPRLVELCAKSGVAVVFVPELPRTRLSGATLWLSKDKALIQLSLRYKTNDQLWFTFFHEAGHILLHGKKSLFLEGKDLGAQDMEDDANDFARDLLIPPKAYSSFLADSDLSLNAIEQFAENLEISPGIVVGRLQREKHLPYNRGNQLKCRLLWKD